MAATVVNIGGDEPGHRGYMTVPGPNRAVGMAIVAGTIENRLDRWLDSEVGSDLSCGIDGGIDRRRTD